MRCGARSFGARTLDGVPPRLSPKGIIPSQRLSFRPGFLGRGLNGRYPPSPVPVQGSTSHPGHNAGRHDTQAAREQAANPPAGTALAPTTQCASVSCPSKERGLWCNHNRDECQERVSEKVTPEVMSLHPMSALAPEGTLRCTALTVAMGPGGDLSKCSKLSAHSITSSPRTSSDCGTSRPVAFAALRLTTVSYLVGACTGRSVGLAPRTMRST